MEQSDKRKAACWEKGCQKKNAVWEDQRWASPEWLSSASLMTWRAGCFCPDLRAHGMLSLRMGLRMVMRWLPPSHGCIVIVVQWPSCVWLFLTAWTVACQASLSFPISEFIQVLVHWIGNAIQPSHPLSSPSLPALNLLADPACKKSNKGMEGERLCSQSWSLEVELTCSVWCWRCVSEAFF